MGDTTLRRIQILPDHVANQIAAGEVVERPASVVKELVENALDAGASQVRIELRGGGKTLIRVADDGEGMSRADALLALDRHATSKIRDVDDLAGVSSFGFRGEALPSIAAVSRFELETAPAEGGRGTAVRAAAGRILSVGEIARRPGTTVTVKALFQNVPARAKFLRAAGVETRAASESVVLLALAHLRTGFRLESNGRELLDIPAAASVGERVASIWGEAEAGQLLAVDEEAGGVRVAGLVQRPDAARPAGGRRYLFVNGRPFRDPSLLREVDDAYRTTVARGVRPSFFLYLGLPRGAVDVNVHPAKAEVRFRDPAAVRAAIGAVVRGRLAAVSSSPGLGPEVGPSPVSASRPVDGARRASPGEASPAGQLAFFAPRARAATGGAAVPDAKAAEPAVDATEALRAYTVEEADELGGGPGGWHVADMPMRPHLWQLQDRYILAATRDGLLIIDQHSAHERVLFEEVMERFRGEAAVSQRLLFPLTLRLSPSECAAVEELGSLLRAVGFEVESFGDRTVIVHAAPQPHPHFDAETCFREMIHELAHGSDLVDSARNQHERIARSLACKGAVKAGQPLSRKEMEELVDRLFGTELPGHDVHGRPTILRLTMAELARRFGRS